LDKINKKELSETDICDLFITPAIKNAGWDPISQIRREVTLTPGPVVVRGNMSSRNKKKFYRGEKTLAEIERYKEVYPILSKVFNEWIVKYADLDARNKTCKNKKLYDLKNEIDYSAAIVDFMSGMTDSFAIKMFNEIITF